MPNTCYGLGFKVAAAVIAFSGSTAVSAQSSGMTEEEDIRPERTMQIEEIMVTARRQQEALMDTPVTVTARPDRQ